MVTETILEERVWGWVPYRRLNFQHVGKQRRDGWQGRESFLEERRYCGMRPQPVASVFGITCPFSELLLSKATTPGCPGPLLGGETSWLKWFKLLGIYCVSLPRRAFILGEQLEETPGDSLKGTWPVIQCNGHLSEALIYYHVNSYWFHPWGTLVSNSSIN